MLKILQARLQQYVNQMFKLNIDKAEEPEIKLPTSVVLKKKQEITEKIYYCFTDYTKPFDCVDQRDGNTRPPDLPPEKPALQVKKQQLEPDMEQQTGSKLGKEYVKAVYCHPAYLTYMQSASS